MNWGIDPCNFIIKILQKNLNLKPLCYYKLRNMYVNISSKNRGILRKARQESKKNLKHSNRKTDRNQKKYYEIY